MGSPPPEYSSVVLPSAPSMDHLPPRPTSSIPPPMVDPTLSTVAPPPVYTQPVMVPYGVPIQNTAPAPVTNIVIQTSGNGGMEVGGGKGVSPLLCPRCKQGILIKQRNKCIKVTIIVLIIITFPFGLLLIPFLCCIWQNKCPLCLRVSGSPVGMKNSR